MNKTMKTLVVGIISLFTFLSFSEILEAQSSPDVHVIKPTKPANKKDFGDFTWVENGKKMSFKTFTKGKVVFVNFWADWCPPCKREIPDIIKLHKNLKKSGLIVIGMTDHRNRVNVKKLEKFTKKNKMSYKNFLMVSKDSFLNYLKPLKFNSIPTTFIINRKGQIVEKIVGMRSYEAFEKIVKKYL